MSIIKHKEIGASGSKSIQVYFIFDSALIAGAISMIPTFIGNASGIFSKTHLLYHIYTTNFAVPARKHRQAVLNSLNFWNEVNCFVTEQVQVTSLKFVKMQ